MKSIAGAATEAPAAASRPASASTIAALSAANAWPAQLLPEPGLWSVKPNTCSRGSFQLLPVLPQMPRSQAILLQMGAPATGAKPVVSKASQAEGQAPNAAGMLRGRVRVLDVVALVLVLRRRLLWCLNRLPAHRPPAALCEGHPATWHTPALPTRLLTRQAHTYHGHYVHKLPEGSTQACVVLN